MHRYNEECKRQPEERYIHSIHSEPLEDDGKQIHVIVTMLPALSPLVHQARATFHDYTYKRVFGEFNEWEVVMFEPETNSRR